ncbi:unnamed protein product [Closterium sp. NIES-54]
MTWQKLASSSFAARWLKPATCDGGTTFFALPCPACRVALPCLSRHPAGCRIALLLHVALPCWLSCRPAAACRVALLAVASPCCRLSRRPALPARRIAGSRAALPCLRVALLSAPPFCAPPCCSRHPDAAHSATRSPAGRRPAARAPPCWQPNCPALAACRSSLVVRRLSLPCALPQCSSAAQPACGRAGRAPLCSAHYGFSHPSRPSLPRLRSMHSRLLVSGLPRSLPPLPPSPALPCLPCVEGRQRAAPHSSSFPPTTAPLQTLHMDSVSSSASGPARTRGGEFSSDLLRDFCRGEGIFRSFTLPASPQQNGVAERRIGLVMEVARTSMIHAAAPHFLWPFAVRYAAHQLNLLPRVSLLETSHALRWTGKVGDASVFRVWGSRAFVRDTFADKLSSRAIPCVFLGFPPDAPGWQFYHPTTRRVLPSQDATFNESVPFHHPLPPQGPAPSGVSQVDPLPLAKPVEVTVDSGAAEGGATRGAASGGAEFAGAELGGAEPASAEPGV